METRNGLNYNILNEEIIKTQSIENVRCWLVTDTDAITVLHVKNKCNSCMTKGQTYYIPELNESLCEDCARDYIKNTTVSMSRLYITNINIFITISDYKNNIELEENEADRLLSSLENSETEL